MQWIWVPAYSKAKAIIPRQAASLDRYLTTDVYVVWRAKQWVRMIELECYMVTNNCAHGGKGVGGG